MRTIFGLFGISFILYEAWFFIRRFKDSFPCLIGFMWFIFFFTTTYSAMFIGLCCLLYAKIENTNEAPESVPVPETAGETA